jgi:hypothetical protein
VAMTREAVLTYVGIPLWYRATAGSRSTSCSSCGMMGRSVDAGDAHSNACTCSSEVPVVFT